MLVGPAQLAEKMKIKGFQGSGSAKSLTSFLTEAGVDKYSPLFEERGVTFDQLLSFTDKDLKDLGVTLLGPRRKLSSAIARQNTKLGNSGGSTTSNS